MLSCNTPLARAKSKVDGHWIISRQYLDMSSVNVVGDRRLYMPANQTTLATYTDESKNHICRISNCLYEQVDPYTFGLCSNHNDRNGEPLFVGDIISNNWCYCEDYAIVCFGEYQSSNMSNDYPQGHYGFYVQSLAPTRSGRELLRKDILYFANQCVIVGNIYDNPDLVRASVGKENELYKQLFGHLQEREKNDGH